QPHEEPEVCHPAHDRKASRTGEGESEHPVQMDQVCPGGTPGRDLERQEHEVERARRRQLAYVADPGAETRHLAVEQGLVGVRVTGKNQHPHRAINSASIPAPKARWSTRTLTAPSERLRQAGTSSRAGYKGKTSVSGNASKKAG